MAIKLEAMTIRLEAIAIHRLEAIAITREAIALRFLLLFFLCLGDMKNSYVPVPWVDQGSVLCSVFDG